MDLKDALWNPLTTLAAGVSVIGHLGFGLFDPVWALISSTSTLWFPLIATSGSTILPQLGFPDIGTKILLAAAVLFVGVQLDKLIDSVQTWYENR